MKIKWNLVLSLVAIALTAGAARATVVAYDASGYPWTIVDNNFPPDSNGFYTDWDNGDANNFVAVGNINSCVAGTGYGLKPYARYSKINVGNTPASWTFLGLPAGNYNVAVCYALDSTTSSNRSENAAYTATGQSTVDVNQALIAPGTPTLNGIRFNTIYTNLSWGGGNFTVSLSDVTHGDSGTHQYLVADAVAVRNLAAAPEPTPSPSPSPTPTPTPVPVALVSHWTLNNTLNDSGTGGNTLTNVGGNFIADPPPALGLGVQSLNFPVTFQNPCYADVNNPTGLNTSSFTIAAFCKLMGGIPTGDARVTARAGYSFDTTYLNWFYSPSTGWNNVGTGYPVANVWDSVIWVVDNTAKTVTLYFNGVQSTNPYSFGTSITPSGTFYINASKDTTTNLGDSWPTVFSDVGYFSGALTAQQAKNIANGGVANYNNPNVVLPVVLVSHWTMNGNANDSNGLNNLTLDSNCVFSSDVPSVLAGTYAQSLNTVGSDAYNLLPLGLDTKSFTFVAFVKTSSTDPNSSIMCRDFYALGNSKYYFDTDIAGAIHCLNGGIGSNFKQPAPALVNLTANQWQLFAYVVDGNAMTITEYQSSIGGPLQGGVIDYNQPLSFGYDIANGGGGVAGIYLSGCAATDNSTPPGQFAGKLKISDAAWFQGALTAQQIQNIANGGVNKYTVNTPSPTQCSVLNNWCNGADIDKSGRVTFADLEIIAHYWLWPCNSVNSWCVGADINQSGTVDFKDFADFAKYWLGH